jgi:hypothetical protein
MKTVLIIQSGAMGDIFIVAPIARFYFLKGYEVIWPVRQPYFTLVNDYLPYVKAVLIDDKHYPLLHSDWLRSDTIHLRKMAKNNGYDIVLDLADRGLQPLELPGETFEETKYRLADVPYAFKHHFFWKPNQEKENDLIAIIEENYDINIKKDTYNIAHLQSSHGDRATVPEITMYKNGIGNRVPLVEITKIRDFEIVDWYPIIENANEIFCVESAVHQFIDGCTHRIVFNKKVMFRLLSRSSLNPGQRYTKSECWDKFLMR